jgi:hypothetical protein
MARSNWGRWFTGMVLSAAIAAIAAGCGGDSETESPEEGSSAETAKFSVTGRAPNGVDITYGRDGTNLQGSPPPFQATMKVEEDALYYVVNAQLQGGGNIRCKVQIGDAVKSGRARGGYNICSAQLNNNPISGDFE